MPALTPTQAFDLAIQLQAQGRIPEAISICRQILHTHPIPTDVLNTLGILHQLTGDLSESRAFLEQAITLNSQIPELHYNLANVHRDLGDFGAAIDSYRRSLELKPDFRPALNNLANALKETGQLPEAKEIYRRTFALHPDPRIASSLLYLMYFDPDVTPREIFDQHANWNRTFARPLAASHAPHPNTADPNKVLKIGYVSPDFRNHPVGRFLLPLLQNHDRQQFEIFCYSGVDHRHADSTTAQIKSLSHHWRHTTRLSPEMLAQQIRQDQIDILLDLTMHMDGNRLLAFAHKPAPVQITYLAYAGTTGLTAIDYRLSDPHLDPPGSDDSIYSEKTLRLNSYWCYAPPAEAPLVAPLPSLTTGHITFGCLNNFSKINHQVLETWRTLLSRVPNSRLILSSHHGPHRDRVLEFFAKANINPDRIEFTAVLPFADYLAQYNRIDIALDPFPYPGGTTSLDALYMGVPVVTLPAQTAVSRAGVTILRNLVVPELIATSTDNYIGIAVRLATDTPQLAAFREQLRPRLLRSPLADARTFAASAESLFRAAWINWCQEKTG